MKITIHPSIVKVDRAVESETRFLNKTLTFIGKPGFVNVGGRIKPTPAPKMRLYQIKAQTFPIGMLEFVKRKAAEAEIHLSIEDKRENPGQITDFDLDKSGMRDYQIAAVNSVLEHRVGILKHATGAGKSFTAICLVQKIDCRWLFLVNSSDLMHQFANSYKEKTGVEAGMIGDGIVRKPEGNLTVATFQTVHMKLQNPNMLKILERVEGLIVDECHTSASETFCNILQTCKSAVYRVGLSGTPFDRSDKKHVLLLGELGPSIHEVSSVELIERGFLASPKIMFVECQQTAPARNWPEAKKRLIVESDKRNLMITGLVRDHIEYPALVFVEQLDHGKSLEKRFQSEGINCKFVHGAKDTKERAKAILDLERGELDVIITSKVFDVGVDIPSLKSIVMVGGGMSVIAVLQRLGRVLRIDKATGKTTCIVFDILDTGNKWMEKHSKSRMKTLRDQGHKVEIAKINWR